MTALQRRLTKFSLSFLWVFTGLTSLFFAPDLGYEILQKGNIEGALADLLILAGASLDIFIGLWILIERHRSLCFFTQMSTVLTFTLLLTFIAPSFWLHPFGPVIKNIPILMLIWIYYSEPVSQS